MKTETLRQPASVRVLSAERNRWVLLVLLSAADFLVLLDATVVNIALPAIQAGLGISTADLQWVISGYVLLFGATLLAWGRLGDVVGHARIFIAGVAVFSVASLLCGTSESSGVLLACRAVQGVGAAMVAPSALALVTIIFTREDERTRALAIWGGMAAIGAAAGLILGGLVTSALSWRWIFLINVPVGIVVLVVAWMLLPRTQSSRTSPSIDWGGVALITAGSLAGMYAFTQVPSEGWLGGEVLAWGAIGATLLALFVWVERRSEAPLVPFTFFRQRRATTGVVGTLLRAAGLFGVFYFASIYSQDVLHYSALEAGLAFLPVPAAIAAGSYAADRLVPRRGATPTALAGLGVSLAGLILLSRLGPDGDYLTQLLPGMIGVYLGMGLSYVPLTLLATSVGAEEEGLASGLLNAVSQIGGAVGLAIVVSVAADRTSSALSHSIDPATALTDGFRTGFLVCAAIIVIGMVVVGFTSRKDDWNGRKNA
jgi:EmrB/QacA subfamily drug resistance transporter